MNSHFVLCQFENLCFENNVLKMASVSTHAFLKSGSETVYDLSQHLHRNCSHFIFFLDVDPLTSKLATHVFIAWFDGIGQLRGMLK